MVEITLDKIKGMLWGAILGDVLGSPYEFNKTLPYSDKIIYQINRVNRFNVVTKMGLGQATDDSEMTKTLLCSLIRCNGYNINDMTLSYIKWGNSGVKSMGKNTRYLFKSIKTIKGYQSRFKKLESSSQSNGSLMRASPLALLIDFKKYGMIDTGLTNNNPINKECTLVYLTMIRHALLGFSKNEIIDAGLSASTNDIIKELFTSIKNGNMTRDLTINKGWVVHALWCAIKALLTFDNYKDAIDSIIRDNPGSDTDTNACIAGALLGAYYGYEVMCENKITKDNIEIIKKFNNEDTTVERSKEYLFGDMDEICNQAHRLANPTENNKKPRVLFV
jgi:ADP-ribosylglycohydrolase